MREIKFRAWDKDKKEMIDWESSYFGDIVFGMNGDKFIPMQFTGLLDKNGKEIYEGDIVKSNVLVKRNTPEGFHATYWEDHNFPVRFEGQEFYPNRLQESEVIGNIYENPELLTK